MKTLILTIGLPRSGKSTWSKKQGHPVVNPDSIRLALYGLPYVAEGEAMVWTIAKYMVRSLFLAGHETVILDATNLREKDRSTWNDGMYVVNYHVFKTPKEVCIKRSIKSKTEYLIPVIERMSQCIELPENYTDSTDYSFTSSN